MDNTDNNGNYYPAIYTRNLTNSQTHIEDVREVLNNRQMAGVQRVPLSAYFNQSLHNLSVSNPWMENLQNTILPLLKYRATLPVDSAATSPNHEIVFVYDIEEITTIAINYLRDIEIWLDHIKLRKLYYMIGHILLKVDLIDPSTVMVKEEVENIEDIFDGQTEDLKKAIPKYEALKTFYNKALNGFDRKKSIISQDLFEMCRVNEEKRAEICEIAEELQKVYQQRWKIVEQCLKLVQKRSEKSTKKHANVVLSRYDLAYGVAQLMLTGHATTIPIENVYSTKKVSKEAVFERIQRRFGNNCTLIYITSSPGSVSIPEKLDVPIWTVAGKESIELLYDAQRDILLR